MIGVAFFRERPQPEASRWRPHEWFPNGRAGGPPPPPPQATPRAADSAAGAPARKAESAESQSRPGLGTEFGESHDSSVEEVSFERADRQPTTVAEIRYDDREGLVARGIVIPPRDAREAEIDLRDRAEPFPGRTFAQPPPTNW